MSYDAPIVLRQAQELKQAFQQLEDTLDNAVFTSTNEAITLSLRGLTHVVAIDIHDHTKVSASTLELALQDCFNQYHMLHAQTLNELDAAFEAEHNT